MTASASPTFVPAPAAQQAIVLEGHIKAPFLLAQAPEAHDAHAAAPAAHGEHAGGESDAYRMPEEFPNVFTLYEAYTAKGVVWLTVCSTAPAARATRNLCGPIRQTVTL